jgi:hypothetical protein
VCRVSEDCSGLAGYACFCVMSCTCSRVSCNFLLHLLFLLWLVDALTVANACIAALEAELTASREAWEGANAAKVAAEKATKSA